MRIFTVHEAPEPKADRLERADELVFVREGFSWGAASFTPFWLMAHRLWLALAAYLAVLAVVEGLIWVTGLGQQAATWVMLGLHTLIGFEADSIRRWALDRNGYRMLGSVSGRTTEEAERRFFEGWLAEQPMITAGGLSSGGGERASTGRLTGRLTGLALGPRGS